MCWAHDNLFSFLTCSGPRAPGEWDSCITDGKPKGLFLIHGKELQEDSFRPSFTFSGDNKSHKICKKHYKNNGKHNIRLRITI
jgi:hypothetical protein